MDHRKYLTLAIPLIISTMTTPLLGAVDTAVVGHLGNPSYIGGVAVGTIVFNTLFWLFGFLRVSTSGFTAQAHGANDRKRGMLALTRPLMLALFIGFSFILLMGPIEYFAMQLINPEIDVQKFASDYIHIRIWSAPFALINYVFLGWLMGMSRIKVSLLLQVFMNVTNICLDLLFVNTFSLGVSGVAMASLLSEVLASIIGAIVIFRISSFTFKGVSIRHLVEPREFKNMMSVNRDLFIRTLCLLTVFNIFTADGASFGTETLAANAILIQIHYIMAYFFDGFANASSILTGKAVGKNDHALFRKTVSLSMQWACYSSIIISALYLIFKNEIFQLFTKTAIIVDLLHTYGEWITVYPFATSAGVILYGVFTGATKVAPVRNSMIYALIIFLIFRFFAVPQLANHGVWLSFVVFSIGRSLFLGLFIRSLRLELFPEPMKKTDQFFYNSK